MGQVRRVGDDGRCAPGCVPQAHRLCAQRARSSGSALWRGRFRAGRVAWPGAIGSRGRGGGHGLAHCQSTRVGSDGKHGAVLHAAALFGAGVFVILVIAAFFAALARWRRSNVAIVRHHLRVRVSTRRHRVVTWSVTRARGIARPERSRENAQQGEQCGELTQKGHERMGIGCHVAWGSHRPRASGGTLTGYQPVLVGD